MTLVYATQWGMDAGKTSKLLFQRSTRYIPDRHITIQGKAIHSVTATFLGISFDTTLPFTNHFHAVTNIARHRLLKLFSLSTSTYGPLPSTTTGLFSIYIRTLLEYGSAATCVANPSIFFQWEKLQKQLITNLLDLPNTLNHDILRWLTNQQYATYCWYLAKRWYSKARENNTAPFYPQTHPILCRKKTTNTG